MKKLFFALTLLTVSQSNAMLRTGFSKLIPSLQRSTVQVARITPAIVAAQKIKSAPQLTETEIEQDLKKIGITMASFPEEAHKVYCWWHYEQPFQQQKRFYTPSKKVDKDFHEDFVGDFWDPHTRIKKNDLFFYALSNNEYKTIESLAHDAKDINSFKQFGIPALHKTTDLKMIRLLIKLGADIYSVDKNGLTLLDKSIKEENEELLRLLVELDTNINKPGNNRITPLEKVFKDALYNNNSMKIIQTLIELGVNPDCLANISTVEKELLLKRAQFHDNQEIVDFLTNFFTTKSEEQLLTEQITAKKQELSEEQLLTEQITAKKQELKEINHYLYRNFSPSRFPFLYAPLPLFIAPFAFTLGYEDTATLLFVIGAVSFQTVFYGRLLGTFMGGLHPVHFYREEKKQVLKKLRDLVNKYHAQKKDSLSQSK